MRLFHPEHGYHVPLHDTEQAELIKAGWREMTDEEWAQIIAAKSKPDEPAKRGPGRPRKEQ